MLAPPAIAPDDTGPALQAMQYNFRALTENLLVVHRLGTPPAVLVADAYAYRGTAKLLASADHDESKLGPERFLLRWAPSGDGPNLDRRDAEGGS